MHERTFASKETSTRLSEQELSELREAIAQYETERPQMEAFRELRPAHSFERDAAEVRRLKGLFARNEVAGSEPLGHALEVVLLDFANSWLPGYISQTSDYDDMLNKTDLVLEVQDENDRIIRIGLDVSAGSPKTTSKILAIADQLRKGFLTKLKYFQSQLDDSTDQKFVPRVVVGSSDINETRQLIRLYLGYRRNPEPSRKNTMLEAIQKHPIGAKILRQIQYELGRTAGLLKNADAPQADIDKKTAYVEAGLRVIEDFAKKKAILESGDESEDRDSLLSTIKNAFATA